MKYEKAAVAATCSTSPTEAATGKRSVRRTTHASRKREFYRCGREEPDASTVATRKPEAPDHLQTLRANSLARRKAKAERRLALANLAKRAWVQLELPLQLVCDRGEFVSGRAEAFIAGAAEGGL